MKLVEQAESSLAGVFKAAPKLSDSAKESVAKVWPWLALIFGVLQLWAAWVLWDLLDKVDKVSDLFGSYFGSVVGYSGKDKVFIYMSLGVLVLDAVVLLMAYPKLVKRSMAGWKLLFLGSLLNVVYSFFNLFIQGRGFGNFLAALVGSAVGFYLLFQVREKYRA